MKTDYAIELAREIIDKKGTEEVSALYMPIQTKDTHFVEYVDDYIEIIAAKNTKALHVEIQPPLAPSGSNPIIYVDDEGKCFRNHGERGYFIMYAERLLDKEITIGLYEHNIQEQKQIDEYVKHTVGKKQGEL